jgi:hypothetical protein
VTEPLTPSEIEAAIATVANREQKTFDTLFTEMVRNDELIHAMRLHIAELQAVVSVLMRVVDQNILDTNDLDAQLRRLASVTAGIKVLKPPTVDDDDAISAWLNHAADSDLTPDVERMLRYLLDLPRTAE